MKRTISSLLAAASVTSVLWFSPNAFPQGQEACKDASYVFQTLEDTQSQKQSAATAKTQACKTVKSMAKPA